MSSDNLSTGSDASAEPRQAVASQSADASRPTYGEKLYQLLFELLPSSVVLLDARGFVLDANPSFCQQIGYAREQLPGLHVSRLSQDSVEVIERNISRLMAGEILEHHVTNVQKDGSLRHYELREAAITLPDGSRGILALSNDITDRLRAQQEKQEIERHLLYAEKLKGLGVMAGGIAHDFNNLLATITGNLELTMLDLEKHSPLQANLNDAFAAARRAADLTHQMLAYSGRGRFDIKEVDLSGLIQGMTGLLRASISKHAGIEFQLSPNLPFIAGDAEQLQQVAVNLITNASEAIGERAGDITIITGLRDCDSSYLARSRAGDFSEPGRYVALEVRDTGCGMDESIQERLFDPFFTTKFTGRGLGLSAVLGVVRGHNGAIVVTSELGKGTAVTVLFPALANTPVRTASVPSALTSPLTPPPPLMGTALVVDDEGPMLLVIERILKRTGLQVLKAHDGVEAVRLFRQYAGEIKFVLLDLTMPRLDGLKTLEELRRVRPQIKIVLTSGYSAENIDHRIRQTGFTAFIQKPFQIETLTNLVRQLCA